MIPIVLQHNLGCKLTIIKVEKAVIRLSDEFFVKVVCWLFRTTAEARDSSFGHWRKAAIWEAKGPSIFYKSRIGQLVRQVLESSEGQNSQPNNRHNEGFRGPSASDEGPQWDDTCAALVWGLVWIAAHTGWIRTIALWYRWSCTHEGMSFPQHDNISLKTILSVYTGFSPRSTAPISRTSPDLHCAALSGDLPCFYLWK